MEYVDIYNDKHELMNYTKGRNELTEGEFRLSCFVWILNDDDKILIQQRSATANKCPNMWETTSGGAIAGDSPLKGVLRELEEELGIVAKKEDIRFIGSFARVNDYVEVFLLKSNVAIETLRLQKDEVQAVKWVTIKEFENIVQSGNASDTSFDVFKKYYEKFYNTYIVFKDGNVDFKKRF